MEMFRPVKQNKKFQRGFSCFSFDLWKLRDGWTGRGWSDSRTRVASYYKTKKKKKNLFSLVHLSSLVHIKKSREPDTHTHSRGDLAGPEWWTFSRDVMLFSFSSLHKVDRKLYMKNNNPNNSLLRKKELEFNSPSLFTINDVIKIGSPRRGREKKNKQKKSISSSKVATFFLTEFKRLY